MSDTVSPRDVGPAVAIALIAALLLFTLCTDPAEAHVPKVVRAEVQDRLSPAKIRRVGRMIHARFERPAAAHKAMRVGACESEWRRWLRGTYWGVWQFDVDARNTYGGNWEDGWSWFEQIRGVWRIVRARGWQPFPHCGSA